MPTPYSGQLNVNEIFASCHNMIISIETFVGNIGDGFSSLVDSMRVDGGLYGDTKLYVDTDILKSYPWTGDNEAANLLNIHRPADPKVQSIVLSIFRQVPLTVDYYLSKRAWGSESAFSDFTSVLLGWLRQTKRVYDETTFNCFVGNHETAVGLQTQNVDFSGITTPATTADDEAYQRLVAEKMAEHLANLFIDLKRPSRSYNDNAFMKSFAARSLKVVWSSKYANMIRKIGVPTIFNKEGLIDVYLSEENVLPKEYFGAINSAATAGDGITIRSLIEQEIGTHHYFAGDLIDVGDTAPAGTSYTVDENIICKVIHEKAVPFMSAFEVGTSFFNAKSLTENHYLTWGHNVLEHLAGKPFITLKAKWN